MKFDISKIIAAASVISNPTEGIGMALNLLKKKNPQMAGVIADMIKSGKNPVEAIGKFAAEGKISTKELHDVKNIYALARKAGFKKFSVPDSVWTQAEQALQSNNNQTASQQSSDWF